MRRASSQPAVENSGVSMPAPCLVPSDAESSSPVTTLDLREQDEHLLLPPDATRKASKRTTAVIALASSLAYACTYFWRYPIFMMPDEILLVSVVTIAGKTLDVHALLGMAFIAGFGSAKLPAMTYVSSQHFFHHRFKALCTIMVVSMLIECCGVLAFAHASPGTMVFCVYLSSFCSSFLYGAIITYLEGRQATEVMLAVGTAGYVCAGTFSRGLGSLVLDMGCPPTVMPLAIGLIFCPLALALLKICDVQPAPSAADVAARSARAPMTSAQRSAFTCRHLFGLVALIASYAGCVGLRSFRDFYTNQVFCGALGNMTAANPNGCHDGGLRPPSWLTMVADIPGAAVACSILICISRIQNNRHALWTIFGLMIGGLLMLLVLTAAFQAGSIGAIAWLILYSTFFYIPLGLSSSPIFERLFAATRAPGTCTYLIFMSDFYGYVATISLLLFRSFGPLSGSSDEDILQLYTTTIWAGVPPFACLLAAAAIYFWWRLPVEPRADGGGAAAEGPRSEQPQPKVN